MNVRLRPPAHRVSGRARLLWGLQALIQVAVAVAVLLYLDLAFADHVPGWLWPTVAVVGAAYVVLMPLARYALHRWETSELSFYTQSGVINRERRIAPFSRVQTVDYKQSFLARVFGLATVRVTTASAAGHLRIAGLDKAVAEQLVDDLLRRTEAEKGDAT